MADRFRAAPPLALLLGSDFKALGVARSLGRRGIPVAVIDSLPRSAWFSKYVQRRIRWQGAMAGQAFCDFLLTLASRDGLEGAVLFALQDEAVEVVSRNAAVLSAAFRLTTQPWEVVSQAHEKRRLNAAASEVGVATPRTWYPTEASQLAALPITFPAIVKPQQSIWLQYGLGLKALPASDLSQLIAQYQRAASIVPLHELMVQELIPGDGQAQFSVAAFCLDGAIHSAMTARRTRQFPIDYGLSSCFVEAIEVPEALAAARTLLRRLRLSGMVEVEFKRDPRDATFKLLDVNVRPWGWHTLAPACGIDFSDLQYRLATGTPLPQPIVPRYGPRWRRLLTDVPAAIQEIRAGRLSPRAYLLSFRGETVRSVADLRDPVPVLGDLAVAAARAFRRAARRRSSAPAGSSLVPTGTG